MGVADRFGDILKANINEVLEDCEDPAKTVECHLYDLAEALLEVKQEVPGVLAEEADAEREAVENASGISRFAELVRKALAAGNEDDARAFLAKKQELEAEAASLQENLAIAREYAQKMRRMHDKLVDDIETLKARGEALGSKVSVVKAQTLVNERGSGSGKAQDAREALDRLDTQIDSALDRVEAFARLDDQPADAATVLGSKYAAAPVGGGAAC